MFGAYEYFRAGRRYFCTRQSPPALFWLLYIRSLWLEIGSLRLDSVTKRTAVRMSLLLKRRSFPLLRLPFFGQIGLPVHGGYKLFDFDRRRVIKVFNSDVDPEAVAAEIESIRAASHLSFVPAVFDASVDGRYYEEEMVFGKRAYLVSNAAYEKYRDAVEACLAEMIEAGALQARKLPEYVNESLGLLERPGFVSYERLDPNACRRVRGFIERQVGALRAEGDIGLDLVFSHGDFSRQNVLLTKRGIAVVDWEDSGYRSPLCDLHNCYLADLYYDRIDEKACAEAIDRVAAQLAGRRASGERAFFRPGPLTRTLYYFERILSLSSRELDERRMKVILSSIDLFERFEQALQQTRQ